MLCGINRLRFGKPLTGDLLLEIVYALQGCRAPSHRCVVLESEIDKKVWVVVLNVGDEIATADNLILNNVHTLDAALHWRLDVHATVQWIERDHPPGGTHRLLPRHDEDRPKHEYHAHGEHSSKDAHATGAPSNR